MTDKFDPPFQEALKDLRELLSSCSSTTNSNDQVYLIIAGCITAELNTKLRICQMAKALGRDTRHVAALLDSRTGSSPKLHDWYLDTDGRYWLHLQ